MIFTKIVQESGGSQRPNAAGPLGGMALAATPQPAATAAAAAAAHMADDWEVCLMKADILREKIST